MLACLPGGARSPGHPSHYTRHPGRHRDPRAETCPGSGHEPQEDTAHRPPSPRPGARRLKKLTNSHFSVLTQYFSVVSTQSLRVRRGHADHANCGIAKPRSPSLKPIRVRFTRCRRACPGPCQGRVGRWGTTQQVQVRRAQGRIWASCRRVHGKGPGHGCSGPTSIHVRGQAEYMYPRPGAL